MIPYEMYLNDLHSILCQLSFTDIAQRQLPAQRGWDTWIRLIQNISERRGTLFLIGNGASASMCSHFATDLYKNARVPTRIFTDAALLTAVSNDISFEEVYATPLAWQAGPEDVLLAISSSGRSPNILGAIRTVRSKGGQIVTLTAMMPDNPMRKAGDLNLYVPADTYGLAESSHAAILHYGTDILVSLVSPAAPTYLKINA